MRRVVETGMIGIHTPSSGQIIISCRSIVLFAKSSATKCVSIFPLHSILLKFHFYIFRTYVDDQEIMHITTPAQGFWNWAHFQGHNIWGNSHNAPFDHSVCTLIYKYRFSFSKSYHFPIALQYYDKFYLTWLHNVTFCGDTNQANILKFTYITIFIKKKIGYF